MEFILIIVMIGGFLFLMNKKGYFNRIKNIYGMLMIIISMNTIDLPSKLSQSPNKQKATAKITEKSLNIVYEYFGESHIVTIPYDRNHIAFMSQLKAELICKNDEILNITQQPGIPYIVSAAQLGGKCIKIYDYDSEKSYDYEGDKIPGYCQDLMI